MTRIMTLLIIPFNTHIIIAHQGQKQALNTKGKKWRSIKCQIHCTLKESEGNLCFYVLKHSYNYPTPLCKCTQPNMHSDIVSGQLAPDSCNKKGRFTPQNSPSTSQILAKFLLQVH